jgi:hypothetical protein
MTVSTAATATVEIVLEQLLFCVRELLHQVSLFGSLDGVGFHVIDKPRYIDDDIFEDGFHAIPVPITEPINVTDQVGIVPYFRHLFYRDKKD